MSLDNKKTGREQERPVNDPYSNWSFPTSEALDQLLVVTTPEEIKALLARN